MSEPVVFYHGTRKGFSKGGYLFPRSFHKGAGTYAPLKPGFEPRKDAEDYIYITTSETLAWVYAWHAPGRGRPKVLVVEPHGVIERDPEHSIDMEAYRCDGIAKVLSVDTEPKINEFEAAAGWVEVD